MIDEEEESALQVPECEPQDRPGGKRIYGGCQTQASNVAGGCTKICNGRPSLWEVTEVNKNVVLEHG